MSDAGWIETLPEYVDDPEADVDQARRVHAGLYVASLGTAIEPCLRDTVLTDGRNAFERLLGRHIRLRAQLVLRSRRRLHAAGFDVDDGMSIATDGFAHALTKFEPARGYRLSTYAINWIRQVLQRSCELHVPCVPTSTWGLLYRPDGDPPERDESRARQVVPTVRLDRVLGADTTTTVGQLIADSTWDPQQAHDAPSQQLDRRLLDGLDPTLAARVVAAAEEDGAPPHELAHPALAGRLLRIVEPSHGTV